MYAAVDVGGTKTLIAVFSKEGKLQEQIKFPTPQEYDLFIQELAAYVAKLSTKDFQAVGLAIPGLIDREHGLAKYLGNLPWKDEPVVADLERIFHCPVVIENDAKLAGLSEALLLKNKYEKALYVTISTGIGIGLINKGVIDDAVGDGGGHDMYVEFQGERITWENLASGSAIVKKYGKRASEIDDHEVWKEISRRIVAGLIDLIAILEPDVIIIGGGVGTHFDKYSKLLETYLKEYESPMLPIPPITKAQRPEEAVIYGCYEIAKAYHPKHS